MGSYPLLLTFILLPAVLGALPKGWKACSSSSKDYNSCLKKEITNALKSLTHGDKKLGVLPIDPLRINELEIPQGKGSVSIKLTFKDLDIFGIEQLVVQSLKNDWKTLEGTILISPNLKAIGNYKIDGKVLVLPISGEGKCNITFQELSLKALVKWKQIEKSGKKYFQMDRLTLMLTPKKLLIHLENLFNGDKALGDNMNVFLNENWNDIYEELRPGITSALEVAFLQIANNVLGRIPVDDIVKK